MRAAAQGSSTDQQADLRRKVLQSFVQMIDDLGACSPKAKQGVAFRWTPPHNLQWAKSMADAPYAPRNGKKFGQNVATLHDDSALWKPRHVNFVVFGRGEKLLRLVARVHTSGSYKVDDFKRSDDMQKLAVWMRPTPNAACPCGTSARLSFVKVGGEERPRVSGTVPYAPYKGTGGEQMTLRHQGLPINSTAVAESAPEFQVLFDGEVNFEKVQRLSEVHFRKVWGGVPPLEPGQVLTSPSGKPRFTESFAQEEAAKNGPPQGAASSANDGAGSSDDGGSDSWSEVDDMDDGANDSTGSKKRRGHSKLQSSRGGTNWNIGSQSFVNEFDLKIVPARLEGGSLALTLHAAKALGEPLSEQNGKTRQVLGFWNRGFQRIRDHEGQDAIDRFRDDTYLKLPNVVASSSARAPARPCPRPATSCHPTALARLPAHHLATSPTVASSPYAHPMP